MKKKKPLLFSIISVASLVAGFFLYQPTIKETIGVVLIMFAGVFFAMGGRNENWRR